MHSIVAGAITLACTSLVSAACIETADNSTSLPIVDLGYELHQALNFDVSESWCSKGNCPKDNDT